MLTVGLFIVMLRVVMLSVDMLSVIMLRVIMLSVVMLYRGAPEKYFIQIGSSFTNKH